MEFIATNYAPIMFAGLICFLLLGFPVAFSLGAAGLAFGFLGIELGVFPSSVMAWLPQRLIGIMANDTLLAVPFFTLMGLILERSGMAEDLLDTVGQVFGPIRGGLALAVIFVGALLAATTGVVAASVISMGLISLPIMSTVWMPVVAAGTSATSVSVPAASVISGATMSAGAQATSVVRSSSAANMAARRLLSFMCSFFSLSSSYDE